MEGRRPRTPSWGACFSYWDKFKLFRKQLADYTPPQQKVAAWNLLYQRFLPTFERLEQLMADLERLAKKITSPS